MRVATSVSLGARVHTELSSHAWKGEYLGESCRRRPLISACRRSSGNGRQGETGVQLPERRFPFCPRVRTLDQPVKRGVTSFLAQRWNDSRSFFGFVPVPFRKVTETTKRWTPIRILAGLILTA